MPAPDDPRDMSARLAALASPVRLVFFTQTFGCDTCFAARRVLDQLASLSERLTVEEHNLVLDKDRVAEFGVDRAPVIAVAGAQDLGLRFYGVPSGHEIESLVEAIELAAHAATGLTDESLAALAKLDRAVHLQVFVTPT